MSLAKKLREVVAANFIEIARVDTPPAPPEQTPAATPGIPIASAEAELDSFLKDIGAGQTVSAEPAQPEVVAPVLETPVPEVVIEPEPVAVEPVQVHLVDAVSDDGDVNFGWIFQRYELPQAAFTAEQAMNMLQALPRDLPLRTKRVTVNTTLSAIGAVVGATPKDIVADANRKKENLVQYLDALGEEVENTTAELEAEIAQLQQEIAQRRETLRNASRKRTAAQEVCQSRMELFDQVVRFFDYDENALQHADQAPAEDAPDPEDMPAFMREDAVRRMLGITEDEGEFDPAKFMEKYGNGEEESAPPAEEAPESGTRGKGRRRSPQREADDLK